jgi:uncharacterized protein (TIRG00374 family)
MNRPEADAQGAAQAKDVCRYRIQRALVSVFAIACLVWVFHDVHPRQLFAAMSIANWGFVMLAISVDILTYILQGIRWKLLLAPVGSLSILRTTQAIYAGLFTNELVPLRFGELVRAFLVSRWLSSRFPPLVPSMVIERCLDAFWLAAGIAVAATLVPVPRYISSKPARCSAKLCFSPRCFSRGWFPARGKNFSAATTFPLRVP